MHLIANILARGDDPLPKLIFGVIVFILWGVAAASSAAKKAKERKAFAPRPEAPRYEDTPSAPPRLPGGLPRSMLVAQSRQSFASNQQQHLPPAPPRTYGPPRRARVASRPAPQLAPEIARRLPNPSRHVAPVIQALEELTRAAAEQAQSAPGRRRGKAPLVPVPPKPPAIAPIAAMPPIAALGSGTQAAARTPAAVDAAAMRSWLQPATLRKQFILTEIFQPPLALREPRLP